MTRWAALVVLLIPGVAHGQPCKPFTDLQAARDAYDQAAAAASAPPSVPRPATPAASALAAVQTATAEVAVATTTLAAERGAVQGLTAALKASRGARDGPTTAAGISAEIAQETARANAARAARAKLTPSALAAYDAGAKSLRAMEASLVALAPGLEVDALLDPSMVAAIPGARLSSPLLTTLRATRQTRAEEQLRAANLSVTGLAPTGRGLPRSERLAATQDAERLGQEVAALDQQIKRAEAAARATIVAQGAAVRTKRQEVRALEEALGSQSDRDAARRLPEHEATLQRLQAELTLATQLTAARAREAAAQTALAGKTAALAAARSVVADYTAWTTHDQAAANLAQLKQTLDERQKAADAVTNATKARIAEANTELGRIETDLTNKVQGAKTRWDAARQLELNAEAAKRAEHFKQLVAGGQWTATTARSEAEMARRALETLRQNAEEDFRSIKARSVAKSQAEVDTAVAPLRPVSACIAEAKTALDDADQRRAKLEQAGEPLSSNLTLPDLAVPPLAAATEPRVTADARFVENIVGGQAAKVLNARLRVTFDFNTGRASGTFSGSGQGDIDAACNTRLHYTYGHTGKASGSLDPATGVFTLTVTPRGSSEARFTRTGTCDFRPAGVGPWSGKGTISGTVTKGGHVTLNSKWNVGKIGVSGHYQGQGVITP